MEENNKSTQSTEHQKDVNLDELEAQLSSELEGDLQELSNLEDDYQKIEDPESLGNTIMDVVWEQFINQVGVVAGEDFVKENRGLPLDLRNSAHIQTTKNFAEGKIATHNDKINYQERYEQWQKKFKHDENGNVLFKYDRIDGENKAVLKKGARDYIDKGRPKGSASLHEDHTVSAGETIRDPEANAHLSQKEHPDFANSEKNLNLLDSSANESKSDHKMQNWLNSERKGEKPADRFNIDEQQLKEKDKEARAEYERVKKEGEKRSIETGKQSQKEEAFRIGGAALKAALMGLLAELVKNIIQKLVSWFRTTKREFSDLVDKLKEAIHTFIGNLKQNLLTAGNTAITAILTAIWEPIIGALNKVWIVLRQGYKCCKQIVTYVKENKKKPFSIRIMGIGEIIISGIMVGGAFFLGEAIEKGLMGIPGFAFEIPLLGSLASLFGMFFGALITGIVGAIAMNLIEKAIAEKMRRMNKAEQLSKANEIIQTQAKTDVVVAAKVEKSKYDAAASIEKRHTEAKESLNDIAQSMQQSIDKADKAHEDSVQKLDDIFNTLNTL